MIGILLYGYMVMANNNVVVTLLGVDKLSGVIRNSILQANLLGSAFQAAMSMANQGIDAVANGIKEAGETQLDLIGSAGALMNILNKDFATSLSFAKQLNNEFVALGAKLPGTAEDFAMVGRSVSDDIISAFKQADGSIDLTNAKKNLMDLTESWTLLAIQTQTNRAIAGQNLARLIGGDNLVLKQVMFDKSPAFKAALAKIVEADGKTMADWQDLTTRQRTEFVAQATRMVIPKDAVDAMSKTVSGTLASWGSMLFDPTTGMVGFLRELPSRFNETALDAFYGMLKSIERLAAQFTRLFPFSADIMVMLWDAFTWIGTQLDRLATWLSGYKTVGDIRLPTIDFGAMLDSLGASILSAATSIQLPNIDLTTITDSVFTVLERIVSSSVFLLNALTYDPSQLANILSFLTVTLTDSLIRLVSLLGDGLRQIEWGNLLASVLEIVLKVGGLIIVGFYRLGFAIAKELVALVANMVTEGLSAIPGMLSATMGFFGAAAKTLDAKITSATQKADAVVTGFTTGMDRAITSVTVAIDKAIADFLTGVSNRLSDISQRLSQFFDSVGQLVGQLVSRVQSAYQRGIADFVGAVQSIFDGIVKAIRSVNLSGIVGGIQSQIQGSVSRLTGGIANNSMVSGVLQAGQNLVSAVTNQPSNSSPNVDSEVQALTRQHDWGNSFDGNLKPLMQAIKTEKVNMPPNANLLIANSSEAILNKRQLGLIGSMPRQQAGNNTFNVSVTINESTSPTATADMVINQLAAYFQTQLYSAT